MVVLILWSATMFHVGPTITPRGDTTCPARLSRPRLACPVARIRLVRQDPRWRATVNDLIGAAGALLLGLTWVWAAVVVFLIGGELNQILADRAGVIGANRTIVGRLRARRDDRLDVVQDDHSDDEAEPDGQ